MKSDSGLRASGWNDQYDRKKILRILLWLILGSSVFAMAATVFIGDRSDLTSALIAFFYTLFFLFMMRKLSVRVVAIACNLGILVLATFLISTGDGVRDVAIVLFPIVLLMTGLLLDRKDTVIISALAIPAVMIVGAAEITGRIHHVARTAVPVDELVILGAFLFFTSLLGLLTSYTIRKVFLNLEASERKYRTIFNATREGIFIHEAHTGRVLDVNDMGLSMFEATRSEIIDHGLELFCVNRPPYTKADALEFMRRALECGPQMFEWLCCTTSGRELWVETSMMATVFGDTTRILSVVRNIDERKRIQDKLRMSEKLQAIGLLASEIVHDFNNQLTVVAGFANILQLSPVMQDEEKSALSGILQAAQQGSDLTRQLLMFTHKENHHKPFDLHAIIRDVAKMVTQGKNSGIVVETDLNAAQSVILGDSSQISNAVLNMALNARDAMPDGGVLSFCTRIVTLDDHSCTRSSFDLVPGKYILLKVIDTGIGMDAVTLSRLFEPFFTTKKKGIGIGAAAVFSSITNHKGSIDVESIVGKGTVCTVLLPLTDTITFLTEEFR